MHLVKIMNWDGEYTITIPDALADEARKAYGKEAVTKAPDLPVKSDPTWEQACKNWWNNRYSK